MNAPSAGQKRNTNLPPLNIVHAQIRMTTQVYKRAFQEALKRGVSMSDVVDKALTQYLGIDKQPAATSSGSKEETKNHA